MPRSRLTQINRRDGGLVAAGGAGRARQSSAP
jgi:hypothetical protein